MLELARSLSLGGERGCLIPHGVLLRIAKRIDLFQPLGIRRGSAAQGVEGGAGAPLGFERSSETLEASPFAGVLLTRGEASAVDRPQEVEKPYVATGRDGPRWPEKEGLHDLERPKKRRHAHAHGKHRDTEPPAEASAT
jgi:hypothetical protein